MVQRTNSRDLKKSLHTCIFIHYIYINILHCSLLNSFFIKSIFLATKKRKILRYKSSGQKIALHYTFFIIIAATAISKFLLILTYRRTIAYSLLLFLLYTIFITYFLLLLLLYKLLRKNGIFY